MDNEYDNRLFLTLSSFAQPLNIRLATDYRISSSVVDWDKDS